MKPRSEWKGLSDKWVLYLRNPRDIEEMGWRKAEFTFDEEGRMWMRTTADDVRRWRYQVWSRTTPWYVADPYQWFPGDLQPPEGARKANERARLPKKLERYKTSDGKMVHVERQL